MDQALVQFRKAAARENRGRRDVGRRYSPTLRRTHTVPRLFEPQCPSSSPTSQTFLAKLCFCFEQSSLRFDADQQ